MCARMTKSSSGACKVQVQQVRLRLRLRVRVHVRVQVGSCAVRTGESGGRALRVGRGRCPRKLQLQELLPFFNAGRPHLEALPLLPPGALEAPDACSVRYDANLRPHDGACALTPRTWPRQLDSPCFVLCISTAFGQGKSASSGSAHGHLAGAAHNGPGFLGGRRSQDRQVPDGPETRTLNTVAPVRRGGHLRDGKRGGGPWATHPGLDHET